MHSLAERVLGHIRRQELLTAGDRVGVAVSGGADSVALLRLLLELRRELGIVLSVVHFNHKLRGAESEADQEFVANLARTHDLEFHVDCGDVGKYAMEKHVSLEAAARELRYGFFRRLLGECPESHTKLDKIVTGHTLDDQAETVLMRLIRGTGLRGLAGIHPRIPVEDDAGLLAGEIVRPLLGVRRCELEKYLRERKQPWREDLTNADDRFTRNRVRKRLLPLLEGEFNPALPETLAELAEIARGEEDYWENEAAGWWGTTVQWSPSPRSNAPLVQIELGNPPTPLSMQEPMPQAMDASVNRTWLLTEPVAVQRRVLRAIAHHAGIPLEFKHVEEILGFAADRGPSGKALTLPSGWKVSRDPESLVFHAPDSYQPKPTAHDYEYVLPIPGHVNVPEAGSVIDAVRIPHQPDASECNRDELLDAALLPKTLRVRNWRAGDRFWPAHTKSAKKIKELLQERHVAQKIRKAWPVVVHGDEIVWVRGFPVPARLQAKPGRDAVLIQEKFLTPGSLAE